MSAEHLAGLVSRSDLIDAHRKHGQPLDIEEALGRGINVAAIIGMLRSEGRSRAEIRVALHGVRKARGRVRP